MSRESSSPYNPRSGCKTGQPWVFRNLDVVLAHQSSIKFNLIFLPRTVINSAAAGRRRSTRIFDFRVEDHSSSMLEKIGTRGPWPHFLEVVHHSGHDFPGAGAPPATWSPHFAIYTPGERLRSHSVRLKKCPRKHRFYCDL